MKRPVIFCDFDGTITVNDNIVAIMRHFQPPGWETIAKDVLDQRISIREGVGKMFALLPASRKEEIVRYSIENAKIRDGFPEFLDFCREQNIQLLVTSGGIDFFVYPILSRYNLPKSQIYCNASDFSGPFIRILWPHACDEHCDNDCGMCKTRIIRSYPPERYFRILIGDSVTDFAGSKLADMVFARSHLAEKCREIGLDYIPYEDFFDVIEALKREVANIR